LRTLGRMAKKHESTQAAEAAVAAHAKSNAAVGRADETQYITEEFLNELEAEMLARVVAEGGKLPLATVLLCHLRYFSDGAVLGGRAFVEAQMVQYQARTGLRQRIAPRPVPTFADWGELTTLQSLRRKPYG